MAGTATPASGSRRGLVQRFTGKAGPLPVWAWALIILAVGYLVYRLSGAGASSSTTDEQPSDTTAQVTGETGSPPASGQGSPAGNLNDSILSQLSGLSGQVDALTGIVQSTPAFDPYGAWTSGDQHVYLGSTTPPRTPLATVTKPAAAPHAPAKVHYYTYAPGKAPKGKQRQQAPAKGPAGTTLHFKRGAGYFYA